MEFFLGLIFVLLTLFAGILLANVQTNYDRRRKVDKKQSDLKFAELRANLQHDENVYQCFHNGHESVWIETNFDAIHRFVMDSYLPKGRNNDSYHYVFHYRMVEENCSIYFAVFDSTAAPENFDWGSIMHHEQWIETPNPINERIEEYKKKARQRTKGASWWQFWRYDNFD